MQPLQLLPFCLLFGLLTSYLAKRQGRRPFPWFLSGFLLGIFGLLLLYIAPPRHRVVRRPPAPPSPQKKEMWTKYWYYLNPKHQQVGPIELPDLAKNLKEKTLSEHSYIWGEGMDEWKTLKELPDLQKELEIALPKK